MGKKALIWYITFIHQLEYYNLNYIHECISSQYLYNICMYFNLFYSFNSLMKKFFTKIEKKI